ncbi:DUF4382 domain-containing protein [Chloroflexota bacterium]
MKKLKILVSVVLLSLLTVMVGACVPQPGPAPTPTPTPVPAPGGTLVVYVTDAPPGDNVTSIVVKLTEVQVHIASAEQGREREQEQSGAGNQTQKQEQEEQQTQQGEGRWISINMSENAATFDLLQIKGVEQFLGTSEVEAGKYTQVRLVVDTIKVGLGGGQPEDATLPSKELKLVHPFDIIAGETTALVIDFDADKMVTVTGAGRIMVKPVIKLTVRQEKPADQKGGEKPEKETAEQPMVEFSCNDFMNVKHISKELQVNAGDSFKIALCSNPTTGFQWSETANISDQAVLQQVNHKFSPHAAEGTVGAAGKDVWTFNALKEGTSIISPEYGRPWEGGEKGEWTFELTVVVK